jgi:uncharacterized membrane protein HdeD (DUF308 family)
MTTYPAGLPSRRSALAPAWIPAVSGVLTLAAGIAALVWPEPTLLVVGVLFGVYLALWGVMTLVAGAGSGDVVPAGLRVLSIFTGILALLAGLVLMVRPGESILTLVWVLGFWWAVLGTMELVRGIVEPADRLWNIVWGLVALAAGIVLLADPEIGLGTLVLIVGIGLILQGLLELGIAYTVHRVQA